MLLDPKTNLLTVILLGVMGTLVLAAIASWLFLGRPDAGAIPAADIAEDDRAQVRPPESALGELASYAVITDRPVFFADRRLPVIEATGEEGEEEQWVELDADQPIQALKAKVAGIVITPEFKLAMVHDQATNTTQVLREGMAMEGEQAAWRLDEIRARSVGFVADDGKRANLELEVTTAALSSPATARPARRRERGTDEEQEGAQTSAQEEEARARAEEVRRRVAERRAQLRAEAERRAREQRDQ